MVMTQLGLDQTTALGEKTAIENGQFVTHSLLRMTGPPHGLLPGMIQPAVDDQMLKVIPADATYAAAGRLDLAKMFDQLKAFCVAVAGDDGRKAFGELEASATAAGLPLPALLSPLGDQWVLYDAKSTGSLFLTGTTLVVDVKDSDKLSQMLTALESLLATMLGGDKPAMATAYQVDGHTIHYIQPEDFEVVRPSWAIVDKKLIVALYPQIVEDAIQQFKADKSLLENAQFDAARQSVGKDGPLVYVNGTEVVRNLYPIVLLLTSGLDDPFGKYDHPVPTAELLPSLQRMLKYVGTDAMSVKWTPDGLVRTQTAANPLLSPLTIVDSVPLWVAAALPSLGTSRAQTDRLASASNLAGLEGSLSRYASDHQGQLAPDLQTLLKSEPKLADSLHSPFGDPKNASDYVYLPPPAGVKAIPPDVVQVYDAAELLSGDGANVLYGDGRVVWLDHDAVDDALKQSTTWRESQAKPK
jgi:prepilin-type processing-associated H-X9-DG protein